jgi:hypothetical protein
MSMTDLLKKGFGYMLMSMGVSSPVKKPVARPKPASESKPAPETKPASESKPVSEPKIDE